MQKIKRKSLLYKSGVEYADYCINHVEGCSHGCKFPCYAMMMKKRCGIIKSYEEWLEPKIVENSLDLLDKEIPRLKGKIQSVHLCFTTDPFMYKKGEVSALTLKIIEKLNKNGIKCTVLTKGIYPKELADTDKYGEDNEYAITLVSLSEKFRKNFEPGTAPHQDRIKSLKYLSDQGLKTWVSMEPYPTPNLIKQDLNEILEKIKFVDEIIFGKLNYNVIISKFENNKDFYQNLAKTVVKFCENNKIDYHIKRGTWGELEKKSQKYSKKKIPRLNNIERIKLPLLQYQMS